MSADQLRSLGACGSYVTRDKGQVLFSQGDEADAFYVLLHGAVEVWVDRAKGVAQGNSRTTKAAGDMKNRTTNAGNGAFGFLSANSRAPAPAPEQKANVGMERTSVLGPGDHIGESALVVEGDRSATIKVVERAIFFALEKKHFGAFLKVAPKLEQGIKLHTKERLLQVRAALSAAADFVRALERVGRHARALTPLPQRHAHSRRLRPPARCS